MCCGPEELSTLQEFGRIEFLNGIKIVDILFFSALFLPAAGVYVSAIVVAVGESGARRKIAYILVILASFWVLAFALEIGNAIQIESNNIWWYLNLLVAIPPISIAIWLYGLVNFPLNEENRWRDQFAISWIILGIVCIICAIVVS